MGARPLSGEQARQLSLTLGYTAPSAGSCGASPRHLGIHTVAWLDLRLLNPIGKRRKPTT